MDSSRQPPASLSLRPPSLGAIAQSLAGLRPQRFEVKRGTRLASAGRRSETAYLVTEGLVAILARAPDGATAEAGLIGPGGLVGHAAALGASFSTSDAAALTVTRGLAFAPAALAQLAADRPRVRRELAEYALARLAEVERLCVCAAVHRIEQRLARWLMSAAAISSERPIEITHQQFAELFGVRRASVTTSLHLLEGEMAVRCRRGRVEIRDMARLESASCGCHWRARRQPAQAAKQY